MLKKKILSKKIKFLIIVAGCRAGAELFQSLLDSHHQIIQFPGTIFFNKKIKNLFNSNYEKIADNFISDYHYFFDSRIKTVERHFMLGQNKDEFYIVNKNMFKDNFLSLNSNNDNKTFDEVIIDLHYAYQKTINNQFNFKEVKYILINTHTLKNTKNFYELFKDIDFEIIHSIRHPLSAINSVTKNWINYKGGFNFNAKDIFYQINLITRSLNFLTKLNKKFFVVQLENMHQNSDYFIDDFCEKFQIIKNENLYNSTFHGKKWWGDAVTGKFLSGLNKDYKIQINNYDYLTDDDCNYFCQIMKRFFQNYGYEINFIKKKYILWKPLKCELSTWKNSFKNKKFKHLLSIPFFYFLRILLINKFFCKYTNFPYSIGKK